jgi:hypothetical protein
MTPTLGAAARPAGSSDVPVAVLRGWTAFIDAISKKPKASEGQRDFNGVCCRKRQGAKRRTRSGWNAGQSQLGYTGAADGFGASFGGRAAEPGIQSADATRHSGTFATYRFSFDVDPLDSGFRCAAPE